MSFRFRTDRIFRCELGKSKRSSYYAEKSDLLCLRRFEQTPRPTAVLVVWRHEETRWVRCPARRTQASELRLTGPVLTAKKSGECARVNLSWYVVPHFVTVYKYLSTGRYVPSALLLVSRPQPPQADCSLATEGRAARRPHVGRSNAAIQLCRYPTHRSFCCCLLSLITS